MCSTVTPIQYPLDDLRLDIVQHASALLMIGSGLAIWRAVNLKPVPLTAIAFLTGLFLLGWFCRFLVRRKLAWANYGFVAGSTIALLAAIYCFTDSRILFSTIFLIFINSVLLARAELLTTGGVLVEIFLLDALGGRDYPLLEVAAFLVLGLLSSWLLMNTLYKALQWYSITYDRAKELLEETRMQRADLKRTLNSLEAAYQTQQRIQRELVEARRRAEEAQRMKERFAANISHELRTPLNLILGFSEVMHFSPEVYGDVNWTPLLSRDIYQIFTSSRHLMEMIDDILDLSYFEHASFTINLEKTNPSDFIRDTVELARNFFRDRPVRLECNIPPDLPLIEIDRTRIRQVLLNLLNNARRFTAQGVVRVSAASTSDGIEVSIEDTGSGIPADKLPHIFDEYYQVDYSLSRKYGGAGLGLAISKRFIEAHHGQIFVESTVGVGSRFWFTLPASTDPALPHEPASPSAQTGDEASAGCLLIVNGDALSSRLLRRYLGQHQIIQINHLSELPDAVRTHQPRAVIHFVTPDAPASSALEVPVPVIECMLGADSFGLAERGIAKVLTKPITAERLVRAMHEFAPVHRLLIVDDDPGFIQLIERFLSARKENVVVLRAYDMDEAVTVARARQPDLILVDRVLSGEDGLEFAARLRSIPEIAHTPVFLITGARTEVESETLRPYLRVVWPDAMSPTEMMLGIQAIADRVKPRFIE